MMLSQCLLEHRSFKLDHYSIPRLQPVMRADYVQNGEIYQIEQVGPHLYYFFPPGSSILSVPFVLLANVFGSSTINPDQTFSLDGETKIEALLAAFLMAVLAAIFFCTARLLLPIHYSLLVTLGGAVGTQIFSTASRAMFTDTWAVLLLSVVGFCLLAAETARTRLRPVLLATLLAWAYVVYPSYVVHVAGISLYLVFVFDRRQLLAYAVTGIGWAVALVGYSWYNFGQLLPNYFRPGRLTFRQFWTALPGNLISPSRGFLVFVPTVIFIAYLLVRFRRQLKHRRLAFLAIAATAAQLIVISGFDHWWGGHSYGPRLMTSSVPWLVLLSTLGLDAMLTSQKVPRFELIAASLAGLFLLTASIFINERGANARETATWNMLPENVDLHPERIWDWRQPQFLAGLLAPPFPPNVPLLENKIDFTASESEKYLWYGWSIAERESRWTGATHATIIFSVADTKSLNLKIRMAPFVAPGRLDQQRLIIRLNGQTLFSELLRAQELTDYTVSLPARYLNTRNVLDFEIPGAVSPASLGLNKDERQIGIRVASIAIEPAQ